MRYNVEIDGQTYQVEVVDLQARPVIALVDGERFEVWPEEEAQTTQAVPAEVEISGPETTFTQPRATAPSSSANELTAPLPGVIVAVMVQPDDVVSRGQELLTLEAMKMKNAIKSHRDGTIAAVTVSVGDQVAHGQPLVTYKE
jgi:glutaconyl-CoA/methylmalonyl-CoA decarboxylase subunit gamma